MTGYLKKDISAEGYSTFGHTTIGAAAYFYD
jgi:hypothetical protein